MYFDSMELNVCVVVIPNRSKCSPWNSLSNGCSASSLSLFWYLKNAFVKALWLFFAAFSTYILELFVKWTVLTQKWTGEAHSCVIRRKYFIYSITYSIRVRNVWCNFSKNNRNAKTISVLIFGCQLLTKHFYHVEWTGMKWILSKPIESI